MGRLQTIALVLLGSASRAAGYGAYIYWPENIRAGTDPVVDPDLGCDLHWPVIVGWSYKQIWIPG